MRLLQFDNVIVDEFTASIVSPTSLLLLSHAHTDHLAGLEGHSLVPIHMSTTTAALVLAIPRFAHLEPLIRAHELASSFSVADTTVTLVDARHCPGSAMFLIENSSTAVLYTGDFRYDQEVPMRAQIPRELLDSAGSAIRKIDHVYLDCTLADHPTIRKIPSRATVTKALADLIQSHLDRDPTAMVHLDCCMIGYESLLECVTSQVGLRTHVSSAQYERYSRLPSLRDTLFTLDASSTRLHSCPLPGSSWQHHTQNLLCHRHTPPKLPCCQSVTYDSHPPPLLFIKPSVLYFFLIRGSLPTQLVHSSPAGEIRMPFSMHSSDSEIVSFFQCLASRNPKLTFTQCWSTLKSTDYTQGKKMAVSQSLESRLNALRQPEDGRSEERVPLTLCTPDKFAPLPSRSPPKRRADVWSTDEEEEGEEEDEVVGAVGRRRSVARKRSKR